MAITTGGDWNRRAIFHAAVIDLDENRYPTIESTRLITRRILECAEALGARGIALPVLGGGYATKRLKSIDAVRVIASEIVLFLSSQQPHQGVLTRVALYVFKQEDADGLPAELKRTDAKLDWRSLVHRA